MKKSLSDPPEDLWQFALACYAQPGMERTCLSLQERGVDVCLLLCGLWLERNGVDCSRARLDHLTELASDWQSRVVHPLRALRHAWRQPARTDTALHDLREHLKRLELEAERHLLVRLAQQTAAWAGETPGSPWLEPLLDGTADRAELHALREAAAAAQGFA